MILEQVLNSRYDHIIGLILLRIPSQLFFFSCWGTENSHMVPNEENMKGDQPVQSHIHAQQPLQPQSCVPEHCPGETGPPSSVFPSLVFSLRSTTYLSPESCVQCGFIWKETMQVVSWKVEFNACKVWLLWHNTFLLCLINFSAHPR